MEITVSLPTLIMLGFNVLIAFAIPIVLFILARGKLDGEIRPFVAGASAMIVLDIVVQLFFSVYFFPTSAGVYVSNHVWAYCLFSGLMAAVIREPGRYLANRWMLKGEMWNDGNAVMFGLGYASLKLITVALMSTINDFQAALAVFQGNAESVLSSYTGEELAAAEQSLAVMCSTPAFDYFMMAVQQCIGFVGNVALTVLVWFTVKKSNIKYLLLAMGLGFVMEFGVNLISYTVSIGIVIQLVYGALTACAVYAAKKVWDKEYEKPVTD